MLRRATSGPSSVPARRDFHVVLVGDCCAESVSTLYEATFENSGRHFDYVATAHEVEAASSVPADPHTGAEVARCLSTSAI